MVMNGLLATIGAAALRARGASRCKPLMANASAIEVGGPAWTCTTLQGVDVILWTVCLMLQLLSVGCALSNVMAIAILDDAEAFRTWLLRNWVKHMASSVLGVNSFVFAMPAAFAVRVWLLTSEPIASPPPCSSSEAA